ncbi:MAG: MaoC family dehydratase [Acetobacteraceae bacterium]|nr:MaoC family dehydratase [Acetobacteraceae bacterium]
MYFDDFQLGQRFTSRSQVMTRERIVAYAEEFDPQPQHLSEEAAAKSNFGRLIASGWHTASVTMRLQYEAAFKRIANGGMGAEIDKLAWLRPVLPGDALRAVVEVQEMRPSRSRPDRGIIIMLTTTLNQKDEPVQTMRGTLLVPRRPQT